MRAIVLHDALVDEVAFGSVIVLLCFDPLPLRQLMRNLNDGVLHLFVQRRFFGLKVVQNIDHERAIACSDLKNAKGTACVARTLEFLSQEPGDCSTIPGL